MTLLIVQIIGPLSQAQVLAVSFKTTYADVGHIILVNDW